MIWSFNFYYMYSWTDTVYLHVRLSETFDEGQDFYIVTELVEGGELFDRIVSKTHYTEKEARDLIKLMLETMAYMHGMGIVHRDLKPENLLLCSGNKIF
jgi:serine/threonine protein kinase